MALREAGLPADKHLEQRGGGGRPSSFALSVPRGEEVRALALLAQRGLPRLPEHTAPASGKLLLSPASERSDSAAALSADLADTLERLPEVAEARVHLALPELEPLSPLGTPRPTASVLLRLRAPLSIKVIEVAELVARAVPGLDPQDVAVVRAPFSSDGPSGAASGGGQRPGELGGRNTALFLGGLVVVLAAACATLLVGAWSRRPRSAKS